MTVVMRKLLERRGHSVREASDGAMGMTMIQESVPDLVVSDLIMPGQEGMETIMAIRGDFPDLKVLAVSGAGVGRGGTWQPLIDAELLGADASLEKPFRGEELYQKVDDLLGSE